MTPDTPTTGSGDENHLAVTRTVTSRLRRQPDETAGAWVRRVRRQTVPHLQGETS
jgi:hypothetical protein